MIPTRNLVNDIRQLLAAGGDVQKDALAKLVWEYAATCRRLNERAQKCLDLLRQGSRREAAALAKQSPDFQEEILLLDFEERPAWLELCERAGFPVSESFDAPALYNIAQELYGEAGALDHLLRMHRRMALGGAPIADRLRILRRIQQADPHHDFWSEDLRAFEAHLLEELVRQVEKADAEADLESLEGILAQLRSNEWKVTPAPELVQSVEKMIVPHRRRFAYTAYGQLAEYLHEAHSTMDEPRCRELLDQWQRVADVTGVQPDAEQAESVAPIREWLNEKQAGRDADAAYENACQALESAIDESEDRQLLEKLAADVLRCDRGMPELLSARFSSRMEELERKAKRRFALAIVSVVGGLLLVAGGLTAYGFWRAHAGTVSTALEQLDDCIARNDGEGGLKVFETLPRELAARPDVAARKIQLEKIKEEDLAWRAAWAKAMEEVEKLIDEAEALAKRAEPPELGARIRELSRRVQDLDLRLKTLVEELKAHAEVLKQREAGRWKVASDQKNRVLDCEQRIASCADGPRGRLEAAFKEHLAGVQKDYRALGPDIRSVVQTLEKPDTPAKDMQAAVTKAQELKTAAKEVQRKVHDLPAVPEPPRAVKAALTLLDQDLARDIKDLDRGPVDWTDREAALKRIAQGYSSPDRLAGELKAFVDKRPQDPLSQDFSRAERMAPQWRAAVMWQGLVEGWARKMRLADSTTIDLRAQQLEKFLADHPQSPHKPAAEAYLAYLNSAKKCLAGGRLKDQDATVSLLNGAVLRNLHVIQDTDDRRYYVTDPKNCRPQPAAGIPVGFSITYIVDNDLATKTTLLTAGKVKQNLRPAPQSVFAEKALQLVEKQQQEGWETLYLEMLELALSHKDIDPLLLVSILKCLLPYAVDSTPFIADQVQQKKAVLDNAPDVSWMDPDNKEANEKRRQAAQIVKSLGSFAPMITEVRSRLDKMASLIVTYKPAGVLLEQGGQVPVDPGLKQGTLYILWDEGAGAKYERVGMVDNGKLKETDGGVSRFPKGSMIFVLSP